MSAEALRRLDDDQLAIALRASAGSVGWPVTPDVVPAVRRLIESARSRTGTGPVWAAMPRRRRTVLLIALVLVLMGGAALAAKLVIDVGAVMIETAPGRPTDLPTPVVTGPPIGTAVTLEEAERITGITARYPAELGPPDVVWTDEGVVDFEPGGETPWIAMAWDAATDLPPIGGTEQGAVLIQFHGQAELAVKVLYEEAGSLTGVDLDGADAFWITGPHEFRLPVEGALRAFRVDGNVLLWQDGADTFRLEVALPLESATTVASSIPR